MVAIPAKDAVSFLKSGYAQYPVVLLFGPNEGLTTERAETLAKATVSGDAGNIVRMDGDALANDPMALADEANAISMFGGMRAIRIRLGSKSIVSALEPILSSPPRDSRIVIEASDLKKTHALRGLLEKAKAAAVLAAYEEDSRNLSIFLDEISKEHGFAIENDARRAILSAIGLDRKQSRLEIEKLFLYCGAHKRITVTDVEAIMTDAASLSVDTVIDAAFTGNLDVIEKEARRVLADGMDPAVLLGFALRHALLLLSIRDMMEEGHTASESIERHRIHFKRQRAVSDQAGRWTDQRLQRAVQLISEATYNTRRIASLAEPLAIRALWSLALAVSRR
jgi:DNA polymerase III subunit delta